MTDQERDLLKTELADLYREEAEIQARIRELDRLMADKARELKELLELD